MIVITEDINFLKLIHIILIKYNKCQNNLLNVFIINHTKSNFLNKLLFRYFQIKLINFEWDFFDLKDANGSNQGQMIKATFAKPFLKIINEIALKKNNNSFDQTNFNIFLIKKLMYGPFFLSKRTLLDNILIVHASKNLIKTKCYKEAIILTENFPFIDILKQHVDTSTITIENFNFYLKTPFLKKLLKSIFFNQLMMIRKYLKLLKNDYHLLKTNDLLNKSIVFDNHMVVHSPLKIDDTNIIDKKSIIFASEDWYLSAKDEKKIIDKGYDFIPIAFYPLGKNKKKLFYTSVAQKLNDRNTLSSKSDLNEKILYNLSVKEYLLYLNGWYDLFNKSNSKIFITVNKFSYSQIAASAAIQRLSGVSAVLQGSFYEFPWSNGILDYDVSFCFSNHFRNIDSNNGSRIKQQVAVGYTNDYKFDEFKIKASQIKDQLSKNGAKKIISFFDQGSKQDNRWSLSNKVSIKGYTLLLNKLIENEWLGLVIKPKKPGILKFKTEAIKDLFDKAQKTGRLYIVDKSEESHIKNVSIIPACIAMASDISIHDTMVSGTAGLEAALTNTPNFYLDLYNFSESIFYGDNTGQIVFKNWDDLWNATLNFLISEKSMKNLHWNKILNQLDPYQDGKSFFRINKYLSFLDSAYKRGYSKDDVLKYAAEKYSKDWGEDKVIIF